MNKNLPFSEKSNKTTERQWCRHFFRPSVWFEHQHHLICLVSFCVSIFVYLKRVESELLDVVVIFFILSPLYSDQNHLWSVERRENVPKPLGTKTERKQRVESKENEQKKENKTINTLESQHRNEIHSTESFYKREEKNVKKEQTADCCQYRVLWRSCPRNQILINDEIFLMFMI